MKFLAIPQPLAQGVADYLQGRPYGEVWQLLEGLARIEPVPEPEPEPAAEKEDPRRRG